MFRKEKPKKIEKNEDTLNIEWPGFGRSLG